MNITRLNYVRKGIYTNIQEFLSHVEMHHTKEDLLMWDGDYIKLGSDRYKTFKFKGLKCKCGTEGKYFAKERTHTKLPPKIISYHMNLYGIAKDGSEVMMTKDHIVPKSKGGKNSIENYETMCYICNTEKADKL
jgi:hypothetical protein